MGRIHPKRVGQKRDFAKAPEIKVLRLFNMKLPHDFNTKNDEAKPRFDLARRAPRWNILPPKQNNS